MGWEWQDGRLAAAQLFKALVACGYDPENQVFLNLFLLEEDKVDPNALEIIEAFIIDGLTVVGMGKKVQSALEIRGIDHLKIVHPAARGKIRQKDRYAKMIETQLGMAK